MSKKEKNVDKKVDKKKKPDETGSILVTEFLKIYDPNSGKVYVSKRGDS